MLFDRITGNLFEPFHLSHSDIYLSVKLSYMPVSQKKPPVANNGTMEVSLKAPLAILSTAVTHVFLSLY